MHIFQLNLLTIRMTELPFDGPEYLGLINGWNGEVRSELPEKSNKSV